MRFLIAAMYLFWSIILWIVWFGMSAFGHDGWAMDLLFIVAIVATTLCCALAALVLSIGGRF